MFEREEVVWLLWWTERGVVARFGWPEREKRRRKEKTRRKEEKGHGLFLFQKEDTDGFNKTRTGLVRHGHEL